MQLNWATLTIAAGQSLSTPLDLQYGQIVRIWGPSVWTAAALTFKGSFNNSAWDDLVDQASAEHSIPMTGAANGFERAFTVPREWTLGMKFVRLRSGTGAVPVSQAADRALQIAYRPFA